MRKGIVTHTRARERGSGRGRSNKGSGKDKIKGIEADEEAEEGLSSDTVLSFVRKSKEGAGKGQGQWH